MFAHLRDIDVVGTALNLLLLAFVALLPVAIRFSLEHMQDDPQAMQVYFVGTAATYVSAALLWAYLAYVFFFQAEDGIRVGRVTGVQTCALPISLYELERAPTDLPGLLQDIRAHDVRRHQVGRELNAAEAQRHRIGHRVDEQRLGQPRSEERRVGKECRSRWTGSQSRKKLSTSCR